MTIKVKGNLVTGTPEEIAELLKLIPAKGTSCPNFPKTLTPETGTSLPNLWPVHYPAIQND